MIPELDPHNPDTHVVLRENDVISPSQARWFRRELERLAGTNPHGQPRLRMVWAATHEDPMQVDKGIKYLDFAPFGERRFIVEIWRSPEFLVRSGRYQVLSDQGSVQDFYFCKGCHAELKLGQDGPARCHKCGSVRSYNRQIREAGEGKLLCDFPAEGCYDYWYRIERANLTYHPPDNEALDFIRLLWNFELIPENQRKAEEQADFELQRRLMIQQMRQQSTAIYTGAVPFNQIPR